MDKGAIKTFAVESRRKLMEDVEYKMSLLGITKDEIAESISTSEGVETFNIGGSATYSIYDEDIKKRERLVQEVDNKGFENVVEEVAYTWFNRIIAIRFMEVNHYLPSKVCVLSSETPGKIEPDIITEAFNIDLDYSDDDKELIFKLKDENMLDELFRFLFVKQCNKLNDILPGLFEKTEDYMELLLNISFTNEGGVVRQLIESIPEEDFTNQVEIIGWLYQYYNSELKDETFANLKKRVKICKERIPAATQLFTPDWIVKYMVENSVGRLWLESHPNEELKAKWKYYVEEAQQTPEVEAKLTKIRNNSDINNPKDIKVIDPCMGSGHILVYVFDVLMQIYVSEGYTERDAAVSILENNLYGLDIDDRAYQLAYFAVMMKARQYNRKILKQNIIPLICSIKESNPLSEVFIEELTSKYPNFDFNISNIINIFNNAKIYGSILNVDKDTFNEVSNLMNKIEQDGSNLFKFNYKNEITLLNDMLFQSKILSKSFDAVITNPPYMGSSGMDNQLKNYLKKHYPNSKSDLFAVFIEKCQNLLSKAGFLAMITQQSFMFLSTFEKLRKDFIDNYILIDMIHLGAHAFEEIGGEVVQATSFIQRNTVFEEYVSTFHRLIDFGSELGKRDEFFNKDNTYLINQNNFDKIPGSPIAYWADKHVFEAFEKGTPLIELSDIKQGLATADNNRFLRYWFEVDYHNIGFNYKSCDESKNSNLKWFPYNKGGKYKKWYGNQDYVINWKNDGYEVRNYEKSVIRNSNFYFQPSISWSKVSSGSIAFRYYPTGFLFDVAGCSIFKDNKKEYLMGFLNSSVSKEILSMISPTLNYEVGHISSLPIILDMNKKIAIYLIKYFKYFTNTLIIKGKNMNLKEIENKINEIFANSLDRQIIFWYDDNQEFEDEIANINLDDAELYILEEDNWIYTKYYIEYEHKNQNFLVYAPFAQPPDKDNYLADMVHYAKRFTADKISLIAQELNIPHNLKEVIAKYKKFWNANSRINAFKNFNIQDFNETNIILGILSVITNQKTINLDYILREVIIASLDEENKFLDDFAKYNILDDFWNLIAKKFKYVRDNPILEEFIGFLLLNYTANLFESNTPKSWDKYLVDDKNNAHVFVDEFMDNTNFSDVYDEIALKYEKKLKINTLKNTNIDSYWRADSFELFDQKIIFHYIDLLYTNKKDLGSNFRNLLEYRKKTHFYPKYESQYLLLNYANLFISLINEFERNYLPDTVEDIIDEFSNKWSYVDGYYRKFYFYYDKIEDTDEIEDLRQLIENMYVNSFLTKINTTFASKLEEKGLNNVSVSKQWRFFKDEILPSCDKHKTAVIISDGFRYGCAVELLAELERDPKREATLKPMISTIPSYTALGMAALLPNKDIIYDNNTIFEEGKRTVLVDGKKCAATTERDAILKEYNKSSLAISYDEFDALKQKELKEKLAGLNLIYVYHNKIDATGDKAISQHNVFDAADDTIHDLIKLITSLSHLNFSQVYITADHGFIYKRDNLEESDKVNLNGVVYPKTKRYILSDSPLDIQGTINLSMDYLNMGDLYVTVPKGADLFKAPGNGLNYVHGGASLEECIIPLLDVKAYKGAKNQHIVDLEVISTNNKITNNDFMLTFFQKENVSQKVLPLTASIYFVDEYDEIISNEVIIIANKSTDSAEDREFKETFVLKNIAYDKSKDYYLEIKDKDSEEVLKRERFIIDLPFQDGFDFF